MAAKGIVTTITLVILTVLVFALIMGFTTQLGRKTFYPPTPLVIATSKTYAEWLAYHYTYKYLSAQDFTIDQHTYQGLLETVASELGGYRSITYDVDGQQVQFYLFTTNVEQQGVVNGFPEFTLTASLYVPSEKAVLNTTLTVLLPIRYYITTQLLGIVASLPNDSTAQQVEQAVEGYVNTLQEVWGTLTIQNSGQVSNVWLSLTDCYLKSYYNVCPAYLGWETVDETLPNLTLSFTSPT